MDNLKFIGVLITLFFSQLANAGLCGGIDHPSVDINYTNFGLLGKYQAVCKIQTMQNTGVSTPITGTLTLTKNVLWVLKDVVEIGIRQTDVNDYQNPITVPGTNGSGILVIEAGTTIVGDRTNDSIASGLGVDQWNLNSGPDAIVVQRGSQIIAEGNLENPIIFTSIQDVLGFKTGSAQWGGIIIHGYGRYNNCSGCQFESEYGYYGAGLTGVSSGTLKYVVIKNTGKRIYASHGIPYGLAFLAVTHQTQIENVHVHNAKPGVQVIGGNADFEKLIITNTITPHFGITETSEGVAESSGPSFAGLYLVHHEGRFQHLVIVHKAVDLYPLLLNGKAKIKNATIYSDRQPAISTRQNHSIYYELTNIVVEDPIGDCTDIVAYNNGSSFINNSWFDCQSHHNDNLGGFYISAVELISGGVNNNTGDANLLWFVNSDNIAAAIPSNLSDDFFDSLNYIGAVESCENNWARGWTDFENVFHAVNACEEDAENMQIPMIPLFASAILGLLLIASVVILKTKSMVKY